MYENIFADDPDSPDDEDFTSYIDDKEINSFLQSKSIKELKLLAEQHKISCKYNRKTGPCNTSSQRSNIKNMGEKKMPR